MNERAIIGSNRQGEVPSILTNDGFLVPRLVADCGDQTARRFVEFFTAHHRNPNTRKAYAIATARFCRWLDDRQIPLSAVKPFQVATYIEELGQVIAAPSVKQHLAAIRMLFDYLAAGGVAFEFNPAAPVRGPKHNPTKGKTPVLDAADARRFLDAIPIVTIGGLRDRALVGLMCFSFARIGAVLKMNVEDYYPGPDGKRWRVRLHEKNGIDHEVPVHHLAEEYLDAYLRASGIAADRKTPLFRTLDRHRLLTDRRLHPNDALRAIKRHARRAGLSDRLCNHTWRATGITAFLSNGGILENAQRIAAHASPRTTGLYDRTSQAISLDEIERVRI